MVIHVLQLKTFQYNLVSKNLPLKWYLSIKVLKQSLRVNSLDTGLTDILESIYSVNFSVDLRPLAFGRNHVRNS